jgi:hypothetical protein
MIDRFTRYTNIQLVPNVIKHIFSKIIKAISLFPILQMNMETSKKNFKKNLGLYILSRNSKIMKPTKNLLLYTDATEINYNNYWSVVTVDIAM